MDECRSNGYNEYCIESIIIELMNQESSKSINKD